MDNRQASGPVTRVRTPAGSPNWITEELIAQTRETWQPFSERPLTPEDALAMLINVGELFEATGLTRGDEE